MRPLEAVSRLDRFRSSLIPAARTSARVSSRLAPRTRRAFRGRQVLFSVASFAASPHRPFADPAAPPHADPIPYGPAHWGAPQWLALGVYIAVFAIALFLIWRLALPRVPSELNERPAAPRPAPAPAPRDAFEV